MNKGFWSTIKKPFVALAPMADVTDAAFRAMFAKYGKPDVTWTEFVSADGLALAPEEGKAKLLKSFEYSDNERPIVAQIFGANPENIKIASRIIFDLGFDGIDINMGCPDKSVEKQCAGAALIKNPARAREIIRAAQEGATDGVRSIPVSVKTRLGWNKDELEEWLPEILKEKPALVTIHARTRKELSLVPARWERVRRAVEIRDAMNSDTLIAGNGDIISLSDAHEKIRESGADGAMVGRGVFGNPWFFNPSTPKEKVSTEEQLRVMIEHTFLFEKMCPHKSFAVMKKHYKAYCHGFDGAKELRIQLMEAENAHQVETLVNAWLSA